MISIAHSTYLSNSFRVLVALGVNLISLCCLLVLFDNGARIQGFIVWFTGGSSRGRRQKRGEDVVHTMKVSLEELYNGTTKKLSLSRNTLCKKCKG